VRIFVDGNPVGDTVADGGGNFTLPQPTPLSSEEHTVYAMATSPEGFPSPPSDTNTFTVSPPPDSPASPLLVTITGDTTDPDDGETTLREAIDFANSDGDMSTVEFDPEVFATAQIITLTQGDLRFLTSITIKSPTGAGVTIKGSNGGTILQLRNQVMVFRVRARPTR
jgi:CSLREA domain-containing protein